MPVIVWRNRSPERHQDDGTANACRRAGVRTMNQTRPFALSLAFALSLPACGGSSTTSECTDPTTPGCVVTSDKERVETPNAPAADITDLVTGNTAFAVDLYKQLRNQTGNLFYSP